MGAFRAIKGIVVILIGVTLFGCTATSPSYHQPGIEQVSEHTIRFVGDTSLTNAEKLRSLLADSHGSITTLEVTSAGGDVMGGLTLGRLVRDHQLSVVVSSICASSCANYIVTASPAVFVKERAILGWHGGALQTLYTPLSSSSSLLDSQTGLFNDTETDSALNDYVRDWQRQETRFFDSINVEQAVTVPGMMPHLSENRNAMLFSYDEGTLARLGLHIDFADNQAQRTSSGERMVQIFRLKAVALENLLARHDDNVARLSL